MYRTLVGQVPFLSLLEEDEINEFLTTARTTVFTPGETLIDGTQNDRFLIILEGNATLIARFEIGGDPLRIHRGPGDFVGGIGFLKPAHVRSIYAYADTQVMALEIDKREAVTMVKQRPHLIVEIFPELMQWVNEFQGEVIRSLQVKNLQLTTLNEKLKIAQSDTFEQADLERELQVARRIQKGILPSKLPEIAGFDFGVRMAQAHQVGGDFFDFIRLGQNLVGIAIGDVSDKGVPASIFMAVTRYLLRAEAHSGLLPREVLQRVNYHLMDMNEAGLFVTMIYGVLNLSQKTFAYARAGHEVPLFFSDNCTSECIDHERGQALGIFAYPEFDENQISFSRHSLLLLNTDGITDAIDEKGDAFGKERLAKVILSNKTLSAQAICDKIMDAIAEFTGSTPQFDDLTLVGIKSA